MINQNKKRFSWRKLWQFRYRMYALIVIVILAPILYSSDSNIRDSVSVDEDYKVVASTFVADKLVRDTTPKIDDQKIVSNNPIDQTDGSTIVIKDDKITIYDKYGQIITEKLQQAGFNMGFIRSQPFIDMGIPLDIAAEEVKEFEKKTKDVAVVDKSKDLKAKSLQEVKPKPDKPVRKDWLSYPKYKIQAPIVYTSYEDLFQKDKTGNIDFTKPIDQGPVDSPVQRKLEKGVVHLAYTPMPGELGNSYIVGHSSNYSYIKSSYNSIFHPIESKSKPGEEFFVYDHQGRELKFCVFEAIKIADTDVAQAYKNYPDKRVVTLQTSILGWRHGRWEATHRWLTRGELCN